MLCLDHLLPPGCSRQHGLGPSPPHQCHPQIWTQSHTQTKERRSGSWPLSQCSVLLVTWALGVVPTHCWLTVNTCLFSDDLQWVLKATCMDLDLLRMDVISLDPVKHSCPQGGLGSQCFLSFSMWKAVKRRKEMHLGSSRDSSWGFPSLKVSEQWLDRWPLRQFCCKKWFLFFTSSAPSRWPCCLFPTGEFHPPVSQLSAALNYLHFC